MSRQEIYQAINKSTRLFMSRDEYLDYLRVRRRVRLSHARLIKFRETALMRLHAIRDCISWEEVEEFLNSHVGDINIACEDDIQIKDIKIRIKGEQLYHHSYFGLFPIGVSARDSGQSPVWSGKIQYNYDQLETAPSRRSPFNKDYDLRLPNWRLHYINDVLKAIGLHVGSGGGTGPYCYELIVFHQDFDALRVMHKLAA